MLMKLCYNRKCASGTRHKAPKVGWENVEYDPRKGRSSTLKRTKRWREVKLFYVELNVRALDLDPGKHAKKTESLQTSCKLRRFVRTRHRGRRKSALLGFTFNEVINLNTRVRSGTHQVHLDKMSKSRINTTLIAICQLANFFHLCHQGRQ